MHDRILQALMGRPNRMAQAQSPSEHLQGRGYLDKMPPAIGAQRNTNPEADKAWKDYALPRVETLVRLGIPSYEAWDLIRDMPDVEGVRRKAYEDVPLPPDFQDLLRR
jgi:hypothetical protein